MLPRLVLGAFAAAAPLALLSAQADWRPLTPAVMPTARQAHAMAFDPIRDRIVLFGGNDNTFTLLRDTWLYDGTTWTQASPATSPPARDGHSMAYDPARGRVVLFGGYSRIGAAIPFNDTWEWDGQNWLRRTQLNSPPARGSHPLVYSPVRGTVITWGGYDGRNNLDDMWEWNGVIWRRIVTATRPPARRASDLAFDPTTGGLVMYSGLWVGDDTWTFDNVDWTQRTLATTPGYRVDHKMVTDQRRQRVVLFGGRSTTSALNDTWEWTGSEWLQRTPPTSPPARAESWIVYDSLRHRSVMFGLSRASVDMWEYGTSAPATWSSFGSGCSGTNALLPALSSAAGPWLGENFELHLSLLPTTSPVATVLLGLSNTTWGSIPLPFPLAPLGMTGCDLLVEPLIQLPIAPSGGAGSLSLGVPNEARLLGARFFAQALVADAGANAAGVILSNGGEAQFGAK